MNRLASAFALALGLFISTGVHAESDVKLNQHGDVIDVTIGGKPFTTYHFDAKGDAKFVRPYLYPILAADGTPLTADQVEVAKTDPKADHPHHRSFYVAHGNVDGADHWSVKQGDKHPHQRHAGFEKVADDTIIQKLEWETADRAGVLLNETRTLKFFAFDDEGNGGSRGVDLTVSLTPAGDKPVTLKDTKEAGLCSIRVPKSISDKSTITNALGQTGEKATWGKPAAWCDTSGQINGKPYGVAILDHPGNPRHPTQWHVRAYGLMSANPFGLHDYDKANKEGAGDLKLEPGKPTTFRYRVVFHEGDVTAAKVAAKYAAFSKE